MIAYDEAGEGGAARLWWLLRHFGHHDVAVLNGGLRAWREAGGPLEEGEPGRHAPEAVTFAARPRRGDTATAEELASGVADAVLLDARAPPAIEATRSRWTPWLVTSPVRSTCPSPSWRRRDASPIRPS